MAKATKKAVGTAGAAKKPLAAPWIYINDSSVGGHVTEQLVKLIPNTFLVTTFHSQNRLEYRDALFKAKDSVNILRDTRGDQDIDAKKNAIRIVKATAIKAGANFASINVLNSFDPLLPHKYHIIGATNHLNLNAGPNSAQTIYKWLFTVLTTRETLYLIPDADMRKIDSKLFPDYEYCTINQSRSKPKDAKIQFVTLILTKPQVTEENKLVWTVADKTGVANFYFQHRGEKSQYTWDWVLALKPGDLKALPRMPMVQIKEKRRVRVVKAPFRAMAAVILTAGVVLKAVGKGVTKVGKVAKMGSSSEWVLEADVDANGKKIDWTKEAGKDPTDDVEAVKKAAKVADEKSEKLWDDAASEASTEAGTETSGDKMKDFL